jgi:hypothetical protein
MKPWVANLLAEQPPPPAPAVAACGVELEYELHIGGTRVRADALLGSVEEFDFPRAAVSWMPGGHVVRPDGISFSLDGGVIECATPIAERTLSGVRSVAAALGHATEELSAAVAKWGRARGCCASIAGYSVHLSFSDPTWSEASVSPTARAEFLAHVLPIVVLCTASARGATTIGVRPRYGGRLELAFGQPADPRRIWVTLVIVHHLLDALTRARVYGREEAMVQGFPLAENLILQPARTRHGWALKARPGEPNPFALGAAAPLWRTRDGMRSSAQLLADWLDCASRVTPLADVIDSETIARCRRCLAEDSRAPLDESSPSASGDVLGWSPRDTVEPDRYTAVTRAFVTGEAVLLDGIRWLPEAFKSWSLFVLRSPTSGERRELSLDAWLTARGSS